jgi:iron complex transport system substrate-binding protein
MKRLMTILMVGLLSGAAMCAQTSATHNVTKMDGSVIAVPNKIDRIVTIFGPAYEKVFMLGAESKIVADGDFHINGWPWSNVIYKRLNQVPGVPNAHVQLNIEELLKYKPDVVFHFTKPAEIAAMGQVGICGVSSVFSSKLTGVRDDVNFYAQVLGGDSLKIAADYSSYFDSKLAWVKSRTDKLSGADRPRVYFANQNIDWTAGKDSDIPELIQLAGGTCVSADVPGGSKTPINFEQLASWDPQFVFVDHAGSSGNATAEDVIKASLADPKYQKISAVKNNQVVIVPTGVFFWDSGVQKILLLQWMAQKLHPQLFADLDMVKELTAFYARFFHYQLTDEQARRILAHLNPL